MIKATLCIVAAAALAGCASQPPTVVDQAVGPDLAPPRVNLSNGQGQLVVYSELEAANAVSSDYPTHAAYDIYDMNGKLVRHVENRSGPFDQSPAAVSLPPAEYKVKARATNHGVITVPVIVKGSETTILDLDSTHFLQHKPTGAGQWVRLPSGEIIGMREP